MLADLSQPSLKRRCVGGSLSVEYLGNLSQSVDALGLDFFRFAGSELFLQPGLHRHQSVVGCVGRGIDLLAEGERQNRNHPDMRFSIGFYLQHDSSESTTSSQVLPIDPVTGTQSSNIPLIIPDNGTQAQKIASGYLQDEWRVWEPFTLNYGLRFDHYSAYSNGSLLQPRINFVWQVATDTTVHGGYSKYFIPPPFELIAGTTIST